jgi:phospholipid/cholesterol/gamma-HCH transport system ATP-binding protein
MTTATSEPLRQDGGRATTTPAVRVDRVTKAFGDQRVLDDVSFEVAAGHGFVILGRSGTGKSVTLRHIIGLIKPDSGRVFVQDDEVSVLRGRELSRVRRSIGFLFQNAALFDSISVGENAGDIRRRVTEKLEAVGLEREYRKMPADLSGGMRKRAGLARAMALDPPILLVDEPSAGLDPITADEIDNLLLALKKESRTTIVIVTHNMSSARRLADELVMLHDGRIVARGTVEDLDRSDDPLVRAFMASQHAG